MTPGVWLVDSCHLIGRVISLRELFNLQGLANLNPSNLIGRVYVGDPMSLLHAKYISCGPHDFREDSKTFKVFLL